MPENYQKHKFPYFYSISVKEKIVDKFRENSPQIKVSHREDDYYHLNKKGLETILNQ